MFRNRNQTVPTTLDANNGSNRTQQLTQVRHLCKGAGNCGVRLYPRDLYLPTGFFFCGISLVNIVALKCPIEMGVKGQRTQVESVCQEQFVGVSLPTLALR